MPERWAIIVEGEPIDLEDARLAFSGDGPVRIRQIERLDGSHVTAIMADELEAVSSTREAYDIGIRLLDWLNGALFVRHANRIRLTTSGIAERNAGGKWAHHTVLTLGSAQIRFRASGMLTVVGPDGSQLPEPSQPLNRWFELATSDDVVANVLTYLGRELDWFDIWKTFEVMRDDWNRITDGADPTSIGWPGKKQLDKFTLSVNVHRHSKVKWTEGYDMQTAMHINVARKLVRQLVEKWLAWRVSRIL